ncbi:hypothetical protein [Halalkalibacter akibai]|uniref:Uncharacterized protein n=1 Tax=Halalkalibacter akibai (strain ATCC 43226 / DSM 21942 / CIP 109018 / JCM 9157 / 1139) TaxID=1236973 RepID=W4QXT8_HALA3|nr:hypothetical protein [Halalkalibacter akibai]GAE36453.1 hypothetical protein JCM9157_3640 [Halalkalibacter akibai JCM 9157]
MLNKEELKLVKHYIYLPLLRKVLEYDNQKIKETNLKFTAPYLLLIEKTINQVSLDLGKVKKEMLRKGITVYNQGKGDNVCKYLIVCRGYRENMNLFPHLMKNEVLEYMEQYLS